MILKNISLLFRSVSSEYLMMFSKQRLSESTSKGQVKRRSNQKQAKKPSTLGICLICSDNATIINYGTLSCQPCKTFFRRNGYHPQVRHYQH